MGDRKGTILRITVIMAIFSLIVPGITSSSYAEEKDSKDRNISNYGVENLDGFVSVMSQIDLKESFNAVIDFVKDIVFTKLGGSLAEISPFTTVSSAEDL